MLIKRGMYTIGIDEVGRAASKRRASPSSHIIGIDEVGRAASKRRASPTSHIIGIDEVGRGALAGPVVVAAVAIPKGLALSLPKGSSMRLKDMPPLKDSKQLSHSQRTKWLNYVKSDPHIFYASARVYQGKIDKKNISRAANIAASKALQRLLDQSPVKKFSVILDGSLYLYDANHKKLSSRTIIRGDERFISIKLASIVAKITRDEYMTRLHKKYPEYEFGRHKGYGTKLHKSMIKKHGVRDTHRLTFIKN